MPAPRKPSYDTLPDDLTPAERVRARKRLWYLKNREKYKQKRQEWNRKKGHLPSAGEHVGKGINTRVKVSRAGRYVIIGELVYFSSELGFDIDELRLITNQLQAALTARSAPAPAKAAKKASAKKSA